MRKKTKGRLVHYDFLLKKSTRIISEKMDDSKIPKQKVGKEGIGKTIKVTRVI